LYLSESILRKTAGEKEVHAVLDRYRKNNPDHAQYMTDYKVEGYVRHEDNLKDIEAEIAELRERQKTEGLGAQYFSGEFKKGSIGHRLMELNKARAANKAYIAKFEKERGLRRKHKFTEEALERQRSIMEKAQNASAAAFVATLPKEYQVEGAVIPSEEWKKAEDAAAAAGKKAISEDWGLLDKDKAAEVELHSNYLKGGGDMSRIQIKDPAVNKAYNTIALNYALDNQVDPKTGEKLRVKWEKGNKFFMNPRYEKLRNFVGSDFGQGVTAALSYTPLVKGDHSDIHKKKLKWQNRMRTAQTERDKMLKSRYQTKTQDATDQYVAERGKKVRGWLKDNWMPLAGLGMGALGILGMIGMRGRQGGQQQQQAPTQMQTQVRQPQIDEWAQNYHFGNRGQKPIQTSKPAGQFNFSNVFNKFMGGGRG
jgi:hypothetical protein